MVSTFLILRDRSAHGAHAQHTFTRAPAYGTCSESRRRGRTFTPASRGRCATVFKATAANSRSGRKAVCFGVVASCSVFPSCDWNSKDVEPISARRIGTSRIMRTVILHATSCERMCIVHRYNHVFFATDRAAGAETIAADSRLVVTRLSSKCASRE